jgi:cysteinyl-tRNA synthetase
MRPDFNNGSVFEDAWWSNAVPSSELVAALSDDLNTADAISQIKTSISRFDSLNDQSRLALVHDARFLGLVTADQRDWLRPYHLGYMPPRLFNEANVKFRHYRVFSANYDDAKKLELENWFANNDMLVSSPDMLDYVGQDLTGGQIEKMIEERKAARAAKNWAKSDRIRDELTAKGILLKDNRDGTTSWEVRQ